MPAANTTACVIRVDDIRSRALAAGPSIREPNRRMGWTRVGTDRPANIEVAWERRPISQNRAGTVDAGFT